MTVPRQRFHLAVLLLLGFICDAAFGSSWQIGSARPNLSLATLLLSSLFVDASAAAVAGASVGLLEASFAAKFVGSFMVTRSLTGWGVGVMEERIFRDSVLIAFATVLFGSILSEGLFFVFAPQPHVRLWALRTIETGAYNAVLSIPLYFVFRRMLRIKEDLYN